MGYQRIGVGFERAIAPSNGHLTITESEVELASYPAASSYETAGLAFILGCVRFPRGGVQGHRHVRVDGVLLGSSPREYRLDRP